LISRGILLSDTIYALLIAITTPVRRGLHEAEVGVDGSSTRNLGTLPEIAADVTNLLGLPLYNTSLTPLENMFLLQIQLAYVVVASKYVIELELKLSGQTFDLCSSFTPPGAPARARRRAAELLPSRASLSLNSPPQGKSQGFTLVPDFSFSPTTAWFDTEAPKVNASGVVVGYDVFSQVRILRIRAILALMLPVSLDAQAAALEVSRLVIQINALLGPRMDAFSTVVMGMLGPPAGRRRLQDSLYLLTLRLIAALRLVQSKIVELAVLQVQLQAVAFGSVWWVDGCTIGCYCYL